MATVKKQGKGYKITVSNGIDINGKQLRSHMTWVPPARMTEKQIEKELSKQVVLFEEQVRHSSAPDSNTRLVDFTERFLREYVRPNLKAKTAFSYEERLNVINQALGHIKLKDLKPGHISAFYANLQENGARRRQWAVCKVDFEKWLKDNNITMTALSQSTGLSLWAIKQAKAKNRIIVENAKIISSVMGEELSDAFSIERDMTSISAGTIHTYHRTLCAALYRAIKWGYLDANPAVRVDLPSMAGRRAPFLEEEDARKLLELLHKEPIKWRVLISFDLLSGLRRGELAGLRWDDVDEENQTITIRQTSNYIPGKGLYVDTPKTANSYRPLRLSRSAFLLLFEYKDWQDSQRAAAGDAWNNSDGRIFTNDFGGPIFPDSISQWFSKFIARTGLPKVTVHSLRHTYASLMIADGTPLIVVSHQLGHAQTSTTANIYAHVIKASEAKATQTFDKFNDVVIKENKAAGN